MSSKWCVYLLTTGNRTYIGSTTDVRRRLRQHNGEIRGGARSTSRFAPNWQIACWISGFANRSEACRWERIIKCRARGFWNRKNVMFNLAAHAMCPEGREYPVPIGLKFELIVPEGDV